jgi:hypothetical protein
MDHTWGITYVTEGVIGHRSNPHRLKVWAPNAEASAVTGQICAISLDHGNGAKFRLGIKYLHRARENAAHIEQQYEDL